MVNFKNWRIFLTDSPLKARLAHGALWGFLGSATARGLALLSSFVIARVLGRPGFGEWGIVQSTMGMVGVFAGFGLGLTTTKYIAELKSVDPGRAGRIIALSVLVTFTISVFFALVFWALAPWIADKLLNASKLTPALRIGTMLLIFGTVNEAQNGTLAGFEAFRLMAKIIFWTGIISFPMTLAGVLWGGLNGGIIALGLNALLIWLLNLFAIRRLAKEKRIRFSYKDCLKERSILWKFSLPVFLSQSLIIPVNWACSAILANRPGGYHELGLFSAANQWRGALLFLPYAAGRVILPVMSGLYASAEIQRLKRLFRGVFLTYLGLGGAGFIAISLLSPLILKGYGKSFLGGEKVIIMLVFSAVCSAVLYVVNQFLFSTDRIWFAFISNIVLAVLSIGLAGMLIPRLGALGLAMSIAIATSCEILWKMAFLKGKKMI